MAHDIIMPVLGMNQDTGTLVRWLHQAGDHVQQGDPVMEIATDKITVEIEAPATGVLDGLAAQAGEEVPVGQTVALILAEGETVPPSHPAPPTAPLSKAITSSVIEASPVARRLAAHYGIELQDIPYTGPRLQRQDVEAYLAQSALPTVETPQQTPQRIPASPKARRRAREQGLALQAIRGTGPEGAVLAADVEAHVSVVETTVPETAAPALREATHSPGRLWQVMAQRLTESWQTVPHFYVSRTVDAGPLQEWQAACQQKYTERVTLTDLLLKVLGVSLQEHPHLNASWQATDGTLQLHPEVNIGLAVAVAEGLLVPVIHNTAGQSIRDIAVQRDRLVTAAQSGTLTLADMTGGTFSLTNLGMLGVERFAAIVNPPEAAILAVGAVRDRVVPVAGGPVIRPMMEITLSCDHRAVDGATAARFLQTLVQYLEAPLLLLD